MKKIKVIVVPETDEFIKDTSHNLEIYITKKLGIPKLKEHNAKYVALYWIADHKAYRVYHIVDTYDHPDCTILTLGNSFLLKEPWDNMGNYRRFEYHGLDDFNFVEIKDGLLTDYEF